jgi:hypothetical protein
LRRNRHQVAHELPPALGVDPPALSPEAEAQQVEGGQLRGERLRAGDADLRAGVRVENRGRAACDRRVDDVAHGQHRRAALARGLDGSQGVGGLA